jgi:hypothetical protein
MEVSRVTSFLEPSIKNHLNLLIKLFYYTNPFTNYHRIYSLPQFYCFKDILSSSTLHSNPGEIFFINCFQSDMKGSSDINDIVEILQEPSIVRFDLVRFGHL